MINHSSIFSHLIFKLSEINTKEFIPLYLDYLEIANYKKECLLSNFSFFISKLVTIIINVAIKLMIRIID